MMHSWKGKFSRREFVATSFAAAYPLFFYRPKSYPAMTIGEALEMIKKKAGFIPDQQTVDTPKSGDLSQPITGIVTTMFPTIDVINKAILLKANLIIAHEPTFYNHQDNTDWLNGHEVYEFKRRLLEENKIVVWRFHDYWHAVRPDGVLEGVLKTLDWQKYSNAAAPNMLTLPTTTLGDVVQHVKRRLDIRTLRFIGDLKDSCSKVLILPGAADGSFQINGVNRHKPDLLICGELREWETAEYIRDSRAMGQKRSLIVLGHIPSEEPGMGNLVQWLEDVLPDLKATHVPSQTPFIYG